MNKNTLIWIVVIGVIVILILWWLGVFSGSATGQAVSSVQAVPAMRGGC